MRTSPPTTPDVDEDGGRLHLGEPLSGEEVVRVGGAGEGRYHEIRWAQATAQPPPPPLQRPELYFNRNDWVGINTKDNVGCCRN